MDAGALVAYGRDNRRVAVLLKRVWDRGDTIYVPAGVVGQVWRDGATQVWLARLLSRKGVDIVPLDTLGAKMSGELCGRAGTADVVDASVVLCAAQYRTPVVTSDVADLRHLDPSVALIVV